MTTEPLFQTITDTHWRTHISHARRTPNAVSGQIRRHLARAIATGVIDLAAVRGRAKGGRA